MEEDGVAGRLVGLEEEVIEEEGEDEDSPGRRRDAKGGSPLRDL